MKFHRILLPLILLSYSFNSFAIGPISVYFGFSASATSSYKNEKFFGIDTSLLKKFSLDEASKTTNRKFSGILGARLFNIRLEGAWRYSPSGILIFQDQSNQDVNLLYSSTDLSGTLFYDFNLVPILVPYIGIKAGYCDYNFTKTSLQEKIFNFDSKGEYQGIYGAGVLGLDLRLSDFIAIGINYSLDYMPFLEKAKISIDGNEKNWNNKNKPIFHNLGLIIKFGIYNEKIYNNNFYI
jgi:hypothetical protein